jgi:hypothetical protein
MYFKAVLNYSTENLWLNPKTGDYEGCDPDTYQDHGTIETITKSTLEELKSELKRKYGFRDAEYDEVNNSIIMSFEGEHDYRTPLKERVPFIETYEVYITKVIEEPVNAQDLLTA